MKPSSLILLLPLVLILPLLIAPTLLLRRRRFGFRNTTSRILPKEVVRVLLLFVFGRIVRRCFLLQTTSHSGD